MKHPKLRKKGSIPTSEKKKGQRIRTGKKKLVKHQPKKKEKKTKLKERWKKLLVFNPPRSYRINKMTVRGFC